MSERDQLRRNADKISIQRHHNSIRKQRVITKGYEGSGSKSFRQGDSNVSIEYLIDQILSSIEDIKASSRQLENKLKEYRSRTPKKDEFLRKYGTLKLILVETEKKLSRSDIDNHLERFHNSQSKSIHLKHQLLQEREDRVNSFPYSPQITNKSRKIWHKNKNVPIYDRVEETLYDKEKKIRKLRSEKKSKEDAELEAVIQSKFPKNNHVRDTHYTDFYSESVKWLQQRDAKILDKQAAQIDEGVIKDGTFTFKPKINKHSPQQNRNINKDFIERQKENEMVRQRKLKRLIQSEKNRHSFSPIINSRSRGIYSSRKKREFRDQKDKINQKNDPYQVHAEIDLLLMMNEAKINYLDSEKKIQEQEQEAILRSKKLKAKKNKSRQREYENNYQYQTPNNDFDNIEFMDYGENEEEKTYQVEMEHENPEVLYLKPQQLFPVSPERTEMDIENERYSNVSSRSPSTIRRRKLKKSSKKRKKPPKKVKKSSPSRKTSNRSPKRSPNRSRKITKNSKNPSFRGSRNSRRQAPFSKA